MRESETVPGWMSAHGVHWQKPLRGTLQLGRTNRFFLGGGKALVNTYYRLIAAMGITVVYDTSVTGFTVEGDRCVEILTDRGKLACKAVVCAAGGYEANLEWLHRYWGDGAYNYIIRGPVYNDGTVLQALYDLDAVSSGQERGFHAIAVDARAPRFDGGIATRLDTIPLGSSSTVTRSASTTRARTSGPSATRCGAGTSPASPIRSPIPSGTSG